MRLLYNKTAFMLKKKSIPSKTSLKAVVLFLLIFNQFTSLSQITNVNVSINILPPYSTYISDYLNNQNKTIVTLIPNGLTSADQATVYFKASIVGDNGVSMITKSGYKPAQGLQLIGAFPKILNGKTLSDYFDVNNLIFTGITYQELVNGNGLPEGNYTICVQVFDFNTDLPLSQMPPMGCSAPLNIQHIDPPLPLSPACGSNVMFTPVQNILINWSYNPGVTPNVQYLLKIVPVLPTQNANDAINTMVTPAFFEKILRGTNYLYGPADPKLIKGQKYAYRIKAFDPLNKVVFKNNGESEVCTFTYGEKDTVEVIPQNSNQNLAKIEVINPFCGESPIKDKQYYVKWKEFKNSKSISGQTNTIVGKYRFEIWTISYIESKSQKPSTKLIYAENTDKVFVQGNASILKLTDKKKYRFRIVYEENGFIKAMSNWCEFTYIFVPPTYVKKVDNGINIKGQFLYQHKGSDDTYVLDNSSITITETYAIAEKGNIDNVKFVFHKNPLTEAPLIEIKTNTDKNGYLNVKTSIDKIGIVNENYSFTSKYGTFNGVLVRGINIKLNNPYFEYLSNDYTVTNASILDIGKLITKTYSFDLKVIVNQGYKSLDGVQQNCENCLVTLLKQNTLPADAPKFRKENEKDPKIPAVDYSKLTSQNTVKAIKDGKEVTQVVFPNLVCTKKAQHHYLIQLKSDELSKGIKVTQVYSDPKTVEATYISEKLPKSKVTGQIFYTYKGAPESYPLNTSLILQVVYVTTQNGKKTVINKFNFDKTSGSTLYTEKILDEFNQKFPDNGKSLGWCVSNSNGEFTFDVENVEDFNNKVTKFSSYQGTGEFKNQFTGGVYRCLRVVVNNGFYTNPDEDIFIEPLKTVNVGKLTSVVKSFNIQLKCISAAVKGQTVVSGNGVPGLDIVARRKGKIPNYFPDKEGNILKAQGIPENLIDPLNIVYTTTNQNGIAYIKNVVLTDGQDFANLYLFAMSPDLKGDFSYNGYLLKNYNYKEFYQNNIANFYPNAVFNSDYEPPTIQLVMTMFPSKPKIKGRVLDKSKSSTGLADAVVTLELMPKTFFTNIKVLTDKDGYFEFNNLVVLKTTDGTVTGPNRKITISKSGYHYDQILGVKIPFVKELGILKEGSQVVLPEVYLTPSSILTGIIKDEAGKPVDCYVGAIGADLKESETIAAGASKLGITFNSKYEINLPPGKNIKIVVWPKDLKYFIDTITIGEIKQGKNTYDIVVAKRLHRFKMIVGEKYTEKSNQGIFIEKTKTIENATVEIEGHIAKTNAKGEANLEFANTSTKNFTIKIKGPTGSGYIEQNVKVTNFETKNYATYHKINLTKGATLSGVITAGGKALNNAVILVERGAGLKPIEAKSDYQGMYLLEGIPLLNKKVTIKIVAPEQDNIIIIGKEEVIDYSVTLNTKNFDLEVFSGFEISQFYGFKLEITKLTKLSENEVELSGFVKVDGSSADFNLGENSKIAFEKLRIKKGNKIIRGSLIEGIPQSDALVTNSFVINLKYGKHINTQLFSDFLAGKTLSFNKNENFATCSGYMMIVDNSFDFPGSYLSFGKSVFYLKGNENNMNVIAFNSQKSSINKIKTYNVCNYKGEALKYKFLQFDAESNPKTSTVKLNGQGEPLFAMDTRITAKFNNITPSDLTIDLGVFEMNHEKILPTKGKQNIKFSLEQWTVEVKNWEITSDKGGITADEGFVNTGVVTVPFKKFHMQNNLLKFENFSLNSLKLGNIVNLQIGSGSQAIFGFDQATGTSKKPHWKLTLVGNTKNPAATFGGIEGLDNNTTVNIEVLSLISNGENLLSFGASPQPLLIYDVVKFTPTTITNYSDYFTLGGKLDYGIPKVSADLTGNIKVVKSGSGAKIELMPQQIEFEGKGFTKYLSLGTNEQKQSISKNKLEFFGTIQEPGKTQLFNCVLSKKSVNGECEINLLPGQNVKLGDKNLVKVTGKKETTNREWGYFSFEGDLQGFTGVSDLQKHIKFTVYGDIKAEGQAIKCNNINTPFGGMELIFDFGKGEMVGNMNMDMDFSEALSIKGTANMRFGGNGFYFMAAAQVTAPVVNTFNAGILVGTYTGLPTDVLQNVVKYNYNKNIPCHLKEVGVKGFFITGARELPLQVPNFSVDIPPGLALVSLSAGATSGIEAQLAMDFNKGLTLNANLLIYAKAWASVAAITCTEASANATAELLVSGKYENKQFFIDGCGSIVLNVKGSQKVPVLVGCSAPEISLATSLGAKYLIHLGSDGFYQKVEFSLGNDASNCTAILNCK